MARGLRCTSTSKCAFSSGRAGTIDVVRSFQRTARGVLRGLLLLAEPEPSISAAMLDSAAYSPTGTPRQTVCMHEGFGSRSRRVLLPGPAAAKRSPRCSKLSEDAQPATPPTPQAHTTPHSHPTPCPQTHKKRFNLRRAARLWRSTVLACAVWRCGHGVRHIAAVSTHPNRPRVHGAWAAHQDDS